MGKSAARITAFTLCLLLCCSGLCFAVSIVSPVANSILYTDSVLVSVKLTEKATVSVTVYEEKDTNAAGEQVSVDVSGLTEADLALLCAWRSSPQTGEAPLLSDGTKAKRYADAVFSEAVRYTNTEEIGFYTKQLTGLQPGLYRVQVDTLDAGGKVTATADSFIAVRQKAEEQKTNVFENQNTSALQFIQNLLKKVFK